MVLFYNSHEFVLESPSESPSLELLRKACHVAVHILSYSVAHPNSRVESQVSGICKRLCHLFVILAEKELGVTSKKAKFIRKQSDNRHKSWIP